MAAGQQTRFRNSWRTWVAVGAGIGVFAHRARLEHAAPSPGSRSLVDREPEAGRQPVGGVEGDRLAEAGVAEFFGQFFNAA